MASISYVMALLRIMRRRPGQELNPDEILDLLKKEKGFRGYIPSVSAVSNAMSELAQLGVLRGGKDERWQFPAEENTQPKRQPQQVDGDGRGGGGGGDGGAGDAGGGDGDNGRGGGLAEVLAHPILFSTGEAGLSAALAAALRG